MASVYRAFDTRLDVERAIKVMSPELAAKEGPRRRFETEARTMAKLAHRHIVTVHDVVDEARRVHIVMELCEGGTLRDRVVKAGVLPPRLAVEATVALLDALAVAHDRGVVHRDVKPHNVLLTRESVPKVTDFGIAHVETADASLTRTGTVMGTWAYMAPEQRTSARDADARSDLYAVGATLYFLLTGKEPEDLYVAETLDARLEGITPALAEAPVPAATVVAHLDKAEGGIGYMKAGTDGTLVVPALLPSDVLSWAADDMLRASLSKVFAATMQRDATVYVTWHEGVGQVRAGRNDWVELAPPRKAVAEKTPRTLREPPESKAGLALAVAGGSLMVAGGAYAGLNMATAWDAYDAGTNAATWDDYLAAKAEYDPAKQKMLIGDGVAVAGAALLGVGLVVHF